MPIDVFSQDLGAYNADRAKRHAQQGLIRKVFAYMGPGPHGPTNREKLRTGYSAALTTNGGEPWGWWVCNEPVTSGGPRRTLEQDMVMIQAVHDELAADGVPLAGWILDIEAGALGKDLAPVVKPLRENGIRVIASLAGTSADISNYDYRELDLLDVPVDWQAYLDSGEGPSPKDAVAAMYRSSIVIENDWSVGQWEYRMLVDGTYRWGRVRSVHWPNGVPVARVDNYAAPGAHNLNLAVKPRSFGWQVDNGGELTDPVDGRRRGALAGRVRYVNIRVTLDTTRTAQSQRDLAGWSALAATARWPGSAKRPVTVYLAEITPDDVLDAIEAGAS